MNQQRPGMGSRTKFQSGDASAIDEEDILSDTKTISQSKSLAANMHGIKTAASNMTGNAPAGQKTKLEKVATEYDVVTQTGRIAPDSSAGRKTPG